MKIDVITLFPEMLEGFLGSSMLKRAVLSQHVTFRLVNPRDFTMINIGLRMIVRLAVDRV